MTQALLNNMNTTIDFNIGNCEVPGSNINDNKFAKIFDNTTSKSTIEQNRPENNITNKSEEINQKQQKIVSKSYCDDIDDVFSSELKTSIQESIAETVVDLIILEDAEVYNTSVSDDAALIEGVENSDSVETQDESNNLSLNITLLQAQNSIAVNVASEKLDDTESSQTAGKTVLDITNENIENNDFILQEETEVTIPEDAESDLKHENNKIDEKFAEDLNIESIEVDTENAQKGSSSDLMQNQTPQEQAVKAMLQADINSDKTFSATVTNTVNNSTNSTEITPSKIIEQISRQMDKLNNSSKVNIVLNPESLGKINLQLINSKDGLTAQFIVATQEAKNLLMNGLDGLKDNLLSHGVNLDNVSIKLSETTDSETQSDWTEKEGSRGGNKQQGSQKRNKEEKPFEQMMFELNNNDKV